MACTSLAVRSVWSDHPEATAPTFGAGQMATQMVQLFIRRMQYETELHVRQLRQQGIPIAYRRQDWDSAMLSPYKCPNCMQYWDFRCCSADQYKWLRDTDHVDAEDFARISRFCPKLFMSQEPDEWKDDDSDDEEDLAALMALKGGKREAQLNDNNTATKQSSSLLQL